MVSLLAPKAADRGLERHSGKTENYEIGMCCRREARSIKENEQSLLGSESGDNAQLALNNNHSLLGQLNINDITIVDPNL